VTWSPTLASVEPFVGEVVDRFGLGARPEVAVSAMIGSTNRLWRFEVRGAAYVVKELSHDTVDKIERRRNAAAFEQAVFDVGRVVMAEPLFDRDGEIVTLVTGTRGAPTLVRVHRWMSGQPPLAISPALAGAAGVTLRVIQEHGRRWSSEPAGSLRYWDQDPRAVIDRLPGTSLEDVAGQATALIASALDVISDAESAPGPWIYSHSDHKPQNSLIGPRGLLVLDWDECGHWPPRLEAVESALRWSVAADDAASAFRAFLEGHGQVGAVDERDFGKWLAALLGWFAFQARRALGEWSTLTAFERQEAAGMARDTIVELEHTLRSLARWSSWS